VKLNRRATAAELRISDELYDDLLHDFLGNAEAALEPLAANTRENHPDEISGFAHMLKGSAATLKLNVIRQAAQELEAAARADPGGSAAREIIAELEADLEELRGLLSTEDIAHGHENDPDCG